MPYKGERPLLIRMVISLSNEIFTYLRASPPTDNDYKFFELAFGKKDKVFDPTKLVD